MLASVTNITNSWTTAQLGHLLLLVVHNQFPTVFQRYHCQVTSLFTKSAWIQKSIQNFGCCQISSRAGTKFRSCNTYFPIYFTATTSLVKVMLLFVACIGYSRILFELICCILGTYMQLRTRLFLLQTLVYYSSIIAAFLIDFVSTATIQTLWTGRKVLMQTIALVVENNWMSI